MTKLIPKRKIGYILDYDPKNPYHVHNNGEKIVITPEQYEKHKDEPYFANIRKQVEEHQAAYPEPEYTETPNPEYRKVYANVKAASNQHFKEHNFNGQTYREYSFVPEAYFGNSVDGVVTDKEGNLYRPMTAADAGKGVTPMFTTTERDYHDGRYFDMSWVRVKTPSKTIKTLKQPLPVNRTYNVDGELDKSINDYIKNNTLNTEVITSPSYYYKVPPLNFNTMWTADVMTERQLRNWKKINGRKLTEEEIQNKLNSDSGTFHWTHYNPNTRQTESYKKSVLYKDVPTYTRDYINNMYSQKLSEEQIRNMYKDLQGQKSLLFSIYPTAEEFLNDEYNRAELANPGKSVLVTRKPTKQEALNNIQLNIYANGGTLFYQRGGKSIRRLIAKKINDRVPGHEGELYNNSTNRTETSNSSLMPIYLSAIQSYRKNDDNYVERLYNFYQDAITNPNSEEILQNYKNITNRQYDNNSDYTITNNTDFIADNIRNFAPIYLAHEDAKSKYLGFPQRGNTIIESEYQPSNAKDPNTKYFKFKYQTPSYWRRIIKNMVTHNRVTKQYSDSVLNTFTAGKGVDPNKGEYISIYDIWDYNTNVFGGGEDNIGKYIKGTPFEIYDRIYLDDYYGVDTSPDPGTYYGRWLPEVNIIDSKNNEF